MAQVTNQEKRKPKGPIKFQIQLNEEQKQAKSVIIGNTITILTGQAGSGKTLVACQAALDALFNREVEKIIVARPVVTAKEEIGFLPGGLKDKLDPFVAPVFDNLYRLYNKEKIDTLILESVIEVIPIAFMRGRNFSNAFVILDEAQNITDSQLELIIGRLCVGSKMVISGDASQIDLKNKKESGLFFFNKAIAGQVEGVSSIHLKTNHRHPIIEPILEIYKQLRD
jgi:phosphate starvation-inducible PhoH-like protein